MDAAEASRKPTEGPDPAAKSAIMSCAALGVLKNASTAELKALDDDNTGMPIETAKGGDVAGVCLS